MDIKFTDMPKLKTDGTRTKLLDLINAAAYYVLCEGHPNSGNLAAYCKIPRKSVAVYLSWLRRVGLFSIVPNKFTKSMNEYVPTDLGYKIYNGEADLYVWQDFIWVQMQRSVMAHINYKGSTGEFMEAMDQYLRSHGSTPFPNPFHFHKGHRPTPFPVGDMPGAHEYNQKIKSYVRAADAEAAVQRNMPYYPFSRPKAVPPQPKPECPPAVTPVALPARPEALVTPPKAPAPEPPKVVVATLRLPEEIGTAVRPPTKEMLMGARAPRRYR